MQGAGDFPFPFQFAGITQVHQGHTIQLAALAYFLVVTNFFYSQTVTTAVFMLVIVVAVTAGLVRFNASDASLGVRDCLRLATRYVAQAVPLMIVEFSFGKRARQGAIGSFVAHGGPRTAWMGAFVVVCAMGIGAYYAVVSGWWSSSASVRLRSAPRRLRVSKNFSG